MLAVARALRQDLGVKPQSGLLIFGDRRRLDDVLFYLVEVEARAHGVRNLAVKL